MPVAQCIPTKKACTGQLLLLSQKSYLGGCKRASRSPVPVGSALGAGQVAQGFLQCSLGGSSAGSVCWGLQYTAGQQQQGAEPWLEQGESWTWLCRSQRGRQHGWGAVTSKWCVKRPLQSASTLPPTSHPLQRGVSSQVPGMLPAWDCPTLSRVQAGTVVPGSSQSLFLIHWPGFVY